MTTYPEPGAKEAHDAALAEKLADVKAGMSDEEIDAIVEATNADPEKDDASALVAELQAVSVTSLPEELKLYDVTDETDDDGVRRIDALAGVEGVGSANVLLDLSGLEQDQIHWFMLYTDLLGELDTTEHTKAELAKLSSRYLYGGEIGLTMTYADNEEGFRPWLGMSWIALDDDLGAGYDLMRELVFDTKVDDPQKLLEQVQALKAGFRSSINSAPASLLLRRGLAATNPLYRYKSYASDLDYYDFLTATEQLLADDPDAAIAQLRGIQAYLNNRENAVALFAGNEESIALNRELADQFLASLDKREITPVDYDLPVPEKSEALVIDSGVQHNILLAGHAALGMEGYDGGLNAVSSLVDDSFLFPLLRDQYGVYTPTSGAFEDDGVYIYAYRDPNIAETLQVLEELPDMVADMELDQETLDGYILSAYSGFAMPEGELTGAMSAVVGILNGDSQEDTLEYMRELKAVTPEALQTAADMYEKLCENGVRSTAGSASMINANADLYEVILNPFNAKDATAKKRYGVIADYMHLEGANDDEKVAALIAYVRGLNDKLNIPHGIKFYGADSYPTEQGFVPEEVFLERLPDIAANAILDACTGSNPRQPTQEEMEKLLKCCYYDTEVDF